MSFDGDLERFRQKVARRARLVHAGVSDHAFMSITEGSPLTGAPGQPVDTGYLRNSWQNVIEGPLVRFLATPCAYAPVIETGTRAAYDPKGTVGDKKQGGHFKHQKSQVGGNHSVALTRTAWPRVVDYVTRQVVGLLGE